MSLANNATAATSTLVLSTSKPPPPSSSTILHLNPSTGSATTPITTHTPIHNLFTIPQPLHQQGNKTILSYSNSKNQNVLSCISSRNHKTIWKSYLPESMCCFSCNDPYYLCSTSKSGKLYIFDLHTGELLGRIQAHNRSVTSLAMTSDFVWTGGEDGIVCLWNLMDLVCTDKSSGGQVHPVFSWSDHCLPVGGLCILPGGRCVSASVDCQVCILEGCNGRTLARISLPSGVTSLIVDDEGRQIYCGCKNGEIHIINVDAHAIASTAHAAKIISTSSPDDNSQPETKTIELNGHKGAISRLILDSSSSTLFSAGHDGFVRIWDVLSNTCIRIWEPWGAGAGDIPFPISDMILVFVRSGEMEDTAPPPLSRFVTKEKSVLAHVRKKRLFFKDAMSADSEKRTRLPTECEENNPTRVVSSPIEQNSNNDEMDRLREELKDANAKIERWQKVNNKLMSKLKKTGA